MKSVNLPNRIPYRKGRFWGYCNPKREIVIDCKYEVACFFQEGLARVRSKFLKWSMIDEDGNTITKFEYKELRDYRQGLAAVCRNNKWGYIDSFGKEIIHCTYSNALSFNEGLAGVKSPDNHKWGFIDQHQNVIVEFIYDEASDFKNGIAKVRIKRNWGIVNRFGILICPCIYEEIDDFKNNLSIVKRAIEGEWCDGVIDINGIEVVSCQNHYVELSSFISCDHGNIIYKYYDSFACYGEFGKKNHEDSYWYSFNISKTSDNLKYLSAKDELSNVPISNNYNSIEPVSENIAISRIDYVGYGLIDSTGKEIVPPVYSVLKKFSDEYFISQNDEGFWGLMDKTGTQIMPHKFTYISQFSKHLFIVSDTIDILRGDVYWVEKKPLWLVDKNGRELNSIRYDAIGRLSENFSQLASFKRKGKSGYLNHNGDEVEIFGEFFPIARISDDLILAVKEERYGIINVNGDEIVECIYKMLRVVKEHSLCRVSKIVETNDDDFRIADGYVDFDGNEYWEGTASDWLDELIKKP